MRCFMNVESKGTCKEPFQYLYVEVSFKILILKHTFTPGICPVQTRFNLLSPAQLHWSSQWCGAMLKCTVVMIMTK